MLTRGLGFGGYCSRHHRCLEWTISTARTASALFPSTSAARSRCVYGARVVHAVVFFECGPCIVKKQLTLSACARDSPPSLCLSLWSAVCLSVFAGDPEASVKTAKELLEQLPSSREAAIGEGVSWSRSFLLGSNLALLTSCGGRIVSPTIQNAGNAPARSPGRKQDSRPPPRKYQQ